MTDYDARCSECIWWDYERVLKDPKLRYEPIGVCTNPDPRFRARFTNFDFCCDHFCYIQREEKDDG